MTPAALLIEADAAKGREMTSYASIRTDVENAGAHWKDAEVVVDGYVIAASRTIFRRLRRR